MSNNIPEADIRALVEKVLGEMRTPTADRGGDGVFTRIEDAIEAASQAFAAFREHGPRKRNEFISAIRKVTLDNKELLSKMVFEETGMGRYEHKIIKHINAATQTPGPEEIETKTYSGANGLGIEEYAPYGVIGAVLPSTHPSETLVNNAIMMLAAGNTVVFNAHPAAKQVSAFTVRLLNRALQQAGAPANLLTCVAEPTIESANIMFNHPKTKLLSITGGPAVVKAAMKSGKKVIAAGPGNPPVVVDETANLARAAERITVSASFDNGVLCTSEKEAYVVDKVFSAFMQEMEKQGNKKLVAGQIEQLAKKAFITKAGHTVVNRNLVGRNANVLAREIGMNLPESTPLLFGETGPDHIFVDEEQMMPFLPIVRVKDFEEGVRRALAAEHGYNHTMSVHTMDMERATAFGRQADCSIFVVNGGTYQGDGGPEGEGTLSFTIATPTGEAITKPHTFARLRRIMVVNAMRFI